MPKGAAFLRCFDAVFRKTGRKRKRLPQKGPDMKKPGIFRAPYTKLTNKLLLNLFLMKKLITISKSQTQ